MPSSHFQKGMLKKGSLVRMANGTLCFNGRSQTHTIFFLSFVHDEEKKVERDKHLAERHRHRNRLEI